MAITSIVRGEILNPLDPPQYLPDGALAADDDGRIVFAGPWQSLQPQLGVSPPPVRTSEGIIIPPMLDAHTHVSQFPIRGQFLQGVKIEPGEGRLLRGLERNVYPAEARCANEAYARQVAVDFLADTLASGVVGGSAYMTVHPSATRAALEVLPETWRVGLVLMDQNCPENLRSEEGALDEDVAGLARDFGPRFILTDRFAVAVSSPLRRRAVALAERLGLRMQTHLNEQLPEKRLVETQLYPGCSSYTDVYRRDGLLDREPILAHCVHMSDAEFHLLARTPSSIAHCPSSNTLLGSGIMPLARVKKHRIPYAICTDVGAGPTTSLLAEMVQFLKVHPGGSAGATGVEALAGVTAAPARMLHLEDACGPLRVGGAMSFIEVEPYAIDQIPADAESAVLDRLLGCRGELAAFAGNAALRQAIQRLARNEITAEDLRQFERDAAHAARRREQRVRRVTLRGKCLYARS